MPLEANSLTLSQILNLAPLQYGGARLFYGLTNRMLISSVKARSDIFGIVN
jgi:hypothetical protein